VNVPRIPQSKDLIFSPRFLSRISRTGHLCSHIFSNEALNDSLLTDIQARNFYEHIFRIQTHAELTLTFVSLPKKALPFKVTEARSAVIVRAFTGRLSAPYGPGHAELRTHETADGEAARGPYVANEAVFYNLRFRRDKEYIHCLRAWSMDALLVNDVAGTPSPFLER
jgi:hypothetical protein